MSTIWFILVSLVVLFEFTKAADKTLLKDIATLLSDEKINNDYSSALHELEDFLVKNKDTTKKSVKKSVATSKEPADFDVSINELFNLLKESNLKQDDAFKSLSSVQDEPIKRENEGKCFDKKGIKYCYKKAFNNECHDNPEMERDCARSCRFCCDDDKTVGVEKCKSFKKMGLCSEGDFQDRLRIFCPRTCEFCGRVPAEPPCVTSKYGCCWDGGVAQDHVGTASDGCTPCQDYYSADFCNKFKHDCNNSWSVAGEQMRTLCPKTCGKCGPHKVCRDDPRMTDSCASLARKGSCTSNFHVMKFSCAKSCELCHKSTIDCKDTTYGCCEDGKTIAKGYFKEGCKECSDIKSDQFDCEFLKLHHACLNHKDRMKVLCPATCGYCANP